MNNYLTILIPTLAGLATILGVIPTYFKFQQVKIINFSLSFSLGVMSTVALSLILEANKYLDRSLFENIIYLLIFINIGILINRLIDKKVTISNNLYKIGITNMVAIILHNIPEGIITALTTSSNLSLGISFAVAIALHNIPEGISIAIPLYYATKNRKKAYFYTIISGFSELLGAVLVIIFFKRYITSFMLAFTLGITSGIMLDISLNELLKEAISYHNKKITITSIMLGIVIISLCIVLTN